MIKVDDRDIKRLDRDLQHFARRAYPFATRNTLNQAAFLAQAKARENIREGMINRNRFTERSVLVDKARTLNVRRQQAVVGSIAPYMETQEFGGTKRKTGSEGVSIATSYSAGQAVGSKPRERLPRKPNKLASIQLRKRRKVGANRWQQNLIAVRQAAASGQKFVFLDLGRRKGLFRVLGGKRKPYVRMVHDLTCPVVRIHQHPWLGPAVVEAEKQLPNIHRQSLEFQARRLRLFGYK